MKRKRHSSTLSRALSLFFLSSPARGQRAVAGIWFAPLTSLMTIGVIGISLAAGGTGTGSAAIRHDSVQSSADERHCHFGRRQEFRP